MSWGERAFLTRWQLALLVLVLFLTVGASIAVGISAVNASHRLAQIQRDTQVNRVDAIQELCEHDNANARHNVQFLETLGAASRTLRLGREIFKQTKDCRAFALRTVRDGP